MTQNYEAEIDSKSKEQNENVPKNQSATFF